MCTGNSGAADYFDIFESEVQAYRVEFDVSRAKSWPPTKRDNGNAEYVSSTHEFIYEAGHDFEERELTHANHNFLGLFYQARWNSPEDLLCHRPRGISDGHVDPQAAVGFDQASAPTSTCCKDPSSNRRNHSS